MTPSPQEVAALVDRCDHDSHTYAVSRPEQARLAQDCSDALTAQAARLAELEAALEKIAANTVTPYITNDGEKWCEHSWLEHSARIARQALDAAMTAKPTEARHE